MRIIEIQPLSNGAHRNQDGCPILPEGWAVIPEGMEMPNYPFGTITTETIDGMETVTSWTAGAMPEPEPEPEPTVTLEQRVGTLEEDVDSIITGLEALAT